MKKNRRPSTPPTSTSSAPKTEPAAELVTEPELIKVTTVSTNAEFDEKFDAAAKSGPVAEERRQDIADLVKQKRLELAEIVADAAAFSREAMVSQAESQEGPGYSKHVNVEVVIIRGSADEAATILRRLTRDRNVQHLVVYAQSLIALVEKLP